MNRRSFAQRFGAVASLGMLDSLGWSQPAKQEHKLRVWPSAPPDDCPFQPSKHLNGIGFTGRNTYYGFADNWFPSWASDDNLYSSFSDGEAGGVRAASHDGAHATCGYARLSGSNPLDLKISAAGVQPGAATPYGGRYPCASLVHNGAWYFGTYCLDQKDPHLTWDVMGPFVGFNVSTNYGRSWTSTHHTPADPLFRENGKGGAKVKMGSPHFVDFGKNMQHSPDGKAYLVAHGAVRPDAQLSWVSGDQIYLARVKPTPQNINNLSRYEFFAGHDASGEAQWTSSFGSIKPLLEWKDRTGCVTVTYNAPLKKFLMFITDGFPIICRMNTYVLEADRITGPWRLVTFMANFGEQAYFVNLPSKFISRDGCSAWLAYSANYSNNSIHASLKSDPPGSGFALTLQEISLLA